MLLFLKFSGSFYDIMKIYEDRKSHRRVVCEVIGVIRIALKFKNTYNKVKMEMQRELSDI